MWLRKAAAKGYAGAYVLIGKCCEVGIGTTQDCAEAVHCYIRALEAGYGIPPNGRWEARAEAEWEAITKSGAPTSIPDLWVEAVCKGQSYAISRLGELLTRRDCCGTNRLTEGITCLTKLAGSGDDRAMMSLGWICEKQGSPFRDLNAALKWYEAAALRTNTQAMMKLAFFYSQEQSPLSALRDPRAAHDWHKRAAEAGDWDAMNALALDYQVGLGVPRDYSKAFNWYRKVDELSSRRFFGRTEMETDVQHRGTYTICFLNTELLKGELDDVFKNQGLSGSRFRLHDVSGASEYCSQLANEGSIEAQFVLGRAFESEDNPQAALQWYLRAAQQGHPTAQRRCAVLYQRGQGVPQNFVEAYKWAILAAAKNSSDVQLRDQMARNLNPQQIGQAQAWAAAFFAREESPSAAADALTASEEHKSSGSGFFITGDGFFVTSFHVVKGASRLALRTKQGELPVHLLKGDPVNDVALLKASGTFKALSIVPSRSVTLGESVFTIGFPNPELQGVEPKLTDGKVSSLTGAHDDARHFQISVAVQPGNSGGPLVNWAGNVVGIVTARLSDKAALDTSGALAQNVNYAVKSSYVLPLLEAVPELAGKLKAPSPARDRKFDDVAKEAQEAAALVLVY